MKNSFDSGHKKRKYVLAAALIGALVLPLCSCDVGGIESKAYEYLASRYSGVFSIISAERESDVTGPISAQFPHKQGTAQSIYALGCYHRILTGLCVVIVCRRQNAAHERERRRCGHLEV